MYKAQIYLPICSTLKKKRNVVVRERNQGLDPGIYLSLGFQGEDWLAAHGGDPVQQIVMAGKGECPEGGGDGWCQVLPGWCPDDASKMRSLVGHWSWRQEYWQSSKFQEEAMIQKLVVKWKEIYDWPTKNT